MPDMAVRMGGVIQLRYLCGEFSVIIIELHRSELYRYFSFIFNIL